MPQVRGTFRRFFAPFGTEPAGSFHSTGILSPLSFRFRAPTVCQRAILSFDDSCRVYDVGAGMVIQTA